MTESRNPEPGKRNLVFWALVLSLAANLVLVVRFIKLPAKPIAATPVSKQTAASSTDALPAAASGGASSAPAAALPETPFLWNQIEHEDYHQYIANLRAVGCPESTIRDLIAADLSQQYAPRIAAIWPRKPAAYWQKHENREPTPAQLKQLEALSREQSAVFRALLGTPINQQQCIDRLYLQVHGSEQRLLFLPDAKRDAAMRALAYFDSEQQARELQNRSSGYSQDSERANFIEKLQILSTVLSPAELDEFRLRHSPTAQRLRGELQYFNASPEEFRQLLDAREADDGAVTTGDFANRGPAVEQVRALFGDDRAREFEKVSDMYYLNARRAVDDAGLPVEYADSAWQISRDTIAAADQLANDSRLTVDERKRRLQELRTQADRQLNDLLGEKIARPIRRNLGVPLHVAETRLAP